MTHTSELIAPFKMQVTINGQVIASKEDWDAALKKIENTMRENQKLKDILKYI